MQYPFIEATPEVQLKIAQQLITVWPQLTAEKRAELLKLPFVWPERKQAWSDKTEVEKTQNRLVWGKEFAPLFPELLAAHQARLNAYQQAEHAAKQKIAQ